MKILSGIEARENYLANLKKQIDSLKEKGITPTLAIILNNDSYASGVYVKNKMKLCSDLGINAKLFKLPESTTNEEMLALINKLNHDKEINGLFVQLPVSKNINADEMIQAIDPNKDVDCFNNVNVGKIWTASSSDGLIKPCTPYGVIELLKYHNIDLSGKNVVIVNRSNIVGKPLAALMLQQNATVTICHSKTKDMKSFTKNADVVICAVGKPCFFDYTYFKKDAILIDVGINRDANNKLCGDINISTFKDFDGAISPVPGGVGPMTVLMLINNLVIVTKKQNGVK